MVADELADWLTPLFDARGMRATDSWAIQRAGVPSLDLMERAGRALAELTDRTTPAGPIAVVLGKGNNAGDGLVAARMLRERGREVRLLLALPGTEYKGDAAANLARLVGEPPASFSPAALEGAQGVIDAIFGTGSVGEPSEPATAAITAINASGATVIAADVPSGVDASTGVVAGAAVRASITVTFHAAKLGLWIAPGKAYAGTVHVAPIGIPAAAPQETDAGLLSPSVLRAVPRRSDAATKFTAGRVLVVGGSTGLLGAPTLASLAAARSGAGYVTAVVPASLHSDFAGRILEVMSLPLADEGGAISDEAIPAALEAITGRGSEGVAVALGPGLGRMFGSQEFARGLAAVLPVPLVIDADALNAHAGKLALLAERKATTVITPHAGEMARLVGSDVAEVERERLEVAKQAARESQAVVVLKGDDTIIAAPDGRVAVSPGDCPALATAGTGDVLSGITAALLAKQLDPFAAASAAVVLHLEAGRAAAVAVGGSEGVLASDVIAALPRALNSAPST